MTVLAGAAYQIVQDTFTVNTDGSPTTTTFSAPTGHVIVGWGYDGQGKGADLGKSYPSSDGTTWTFAFGGPGGGISFPVYLICVGSC